MAFSLSLPVAEIPDPDATRMPEGLKRVLLVDDSAANRDILARQLNVIGIETVPCGSGAEALKKIADGADLVVTTHAMPEMDGMELTDAIRGAGHQTPIILLSANTGAAENDPARQHLHAMLQKPVSRQELFTALKTVEICAAPAPAVTHPVQDASPAEIEAPPAGEKRAMRVLAAEDNKTNRLVYSKMVKALDIDLKFAENGIEAVELYQSFNPDIVFMDISMPEMDGKEATGKIRGIEKGTGRHVPIVAMTAHAMGGDQDGILAAGLDFYLTKPLKKPAIIERIAAARPEEARDPLSDRQADG